MLITITINIINEHGVEKTNHYNIIVLRFEYFSPPYSYYIIIFITCNNNQFELTSCFLKRKLIYIYLILILKKLLIIHPCT